MCIISSVDIEDDQELRHLFFTAFPVIQTETWKMPPPIIDFLKKLFSDFYHGVTIHKYIQTPI